MALVNLPIELLSFILSDLDFRDVLHCRGVCAMLKSVIDEDIRMQYKIELAVAGMEDGLHSTLTASERLAVLRKRQNAWKKLAWLSQKDIPAVLNNALWEFYGGVFARDQNRRTLHFMQLPSQIRRITGREWTLEDVGVTMHDFGMDPGQDLLVIVEEVQQSALCNIHLKSMTTGNAHPLAAQGVLVHRPESGLFNRYSIQTSNDHLAMLLNNVLGDDEELNSEFVIWNWKTGSLLLDVIGEDLNSFVFLTPNHILFLTYRHSAIIDGVVRDYTTDPCMVVIDLQATHYRNESILMTQLEYLCAFTYPVLHPEANIVGMALRTDPAPQWLPSPSQEVPFFVSGSNRLLVVTLQIVHDLRRRSMSSLFSFIPSVTLLSAIKSLPPGQTRRTFTWHEWGPDGSRFQTPPPRFSFNMPCYVYGNSFAMHVQPPSPSRTLKITLYDFNPLACRRVLLSGQDGDVPESDRAALVTTSTKLTGRRVRDIFERTVTTRCPYLLREVEIADNDDEERLVFNELMLGEDSLILVSDESMESDLFYRVLTF